MKRDVTAAPKGEETAAEVPNGLGDECILKQEEMSGRSYQMLTGLSPQVSEIENIDTILHAYT